MREDSPTSDGRVIRFLLVLLALTVTLRPGLRPAAATINGGSASRNSRPTSRTGTAAYLPAVTKAAAPVRNVIIMISDGWGYNQVEATSFYAWGQADGQVYHSFPVRYGMSTYLAGGAYDPEQAWREFGYVRRGATDSAAAATAMSTGIKTYAGAVGVDPARQPAWHALQAAEALGKATGVVSSVQLSHATPASFVAHNADRANYAEIANEMIYSSALDLIMGTGHPCFDADGAANGCTNSHKYVGGVETWADLSDAGGALGADADGDGLRDAWTLVETRGAFQALTAGPTPARVIGVPQVYQTLQQGRTGGDGGEDPFVVPLNPSVPTLEEMTKAALNVLDNDPDGLFLVIEGGAVDRAGHANQSGRMIEEQMDFDRSVQAVIDWVGANSNWTETILIVTGDHETGYLAGPGSDPGWEPVANRGAGSLPDMEWHSRSHTNSLIPLFAEGSAAALFRQHAHQVDPVRGPYVDNVDLASVVFAALGSPQPQMPASPQSQ